MPKSIFPKQFSTTAAPTFFMLSKTQGTLFKFLCKGRLTLRNLFAHQIKKSLFLQKKSKKIVLRK